MKLYERYLVCTVDNKLSNKILNESVASFATDIYEFITRYSPRTKEKIHKLKRIKLAKFETCKKYYTEKQHGYSLGFDINLRYHSTTVKSSQYTKCKVGAFYDYAKGMLELLKNDKMNLCSKNKNKEKCYKWIDKKIKKFEKDFQELRFAVRFAKQKIRK